MFPTKVMGSYPLQLEASVNLFFCKLPWPWCLFTAVGKQLKDSNHSWWLPVWIATLVSTFTLFSLCNPGRTYCLFLPWECVTLVIGIQWASVDWPMNAMPFCVPLGSAPRFSWWLITPELFPNTTVLCFSGISKQLSSQLDYKGKYREMTGTKAGFYLAMQEKTEMLV